MCYTKLPSHWFVSVLTVNHDVVQTINKLPEIPQLAGFAFVISVSLCVLSGKIHSSVVYFSSISYLLFNSPKCYFQCLKWGISQNYFLKNDVRSKLKWNKMHIPNLCRWSFIYTESGRLFWKHSCSYLITCSLSPWLLSSALIFCRRRVISASIHLALWSTCCRTGQISLALASQSYKASHLQTLSKSNISLYCSLDENSMHIFLW